MTQAVILRDRLFALELAGTEGIMQLLANVDEMLSRLAY